MNLYRRALAILVVTMLMLGLAMYLMHSMQGGEPLTPERLLQMAQDKLGKLLHDAKDLPEQANRFLKDIAQKLPKR